MKLHAIAAVIVCLTSATVLQAGTPQEAEQKTLQRLVSRLPRIDTSSVACPPFDARFEWKATNGGYRADFRYRRPDRLEATMTDSTDGAPCLLYRDQTVMVFDPTSPRFLVVSGHMLDFGFREGDDGKVAFGANIGFGREHVQRIRFDIAQVMQAHEGVLTNQNSTDSVIRLRQTRGDHRDELELRVGEQPVCILKTFEGDRPEPESSMILTLFPDKSSPLFTSPDLEKIRKEMPVELPANPKLADGILGLAEGMKTVAALYHSVYSHIAVLQPSVRDEMKMPGFATPDWDAVARHKKESGPKLRELCGLPAPSMNLDNAPLTPTFAADEIDPVK